MRTSRGSDAADTNAPIGPGAVGRRVTLRYRTTGDPAHPFSEVVGVLLSFADGAVRVRRRDGDVVDIDASAVVAGRVVPDAPHRRPRGTTQISADDLERVAAAGWPALETARLGEWLLRAAGGFSGRANAALAVGDPGLPVDEALDHVIRWYQDRDLPARVQVVMGGPREEALARLGWVAVPAGSAHSGVLVQTAGILPVLARLPYGPGTTDARVDTAPDDAWLTVYRDGSAPPAARAALASHPRAGYASVDEGGRRVAVGRVAVDGDWAGLGAVEVVPDLRRRGLARAVVRSLLLWARDRGARYGYLQVGETDEPAVALYRSMGFVTHHRYRYLGARVG